MILNKAASLYGMPDKNLIHYFNGEPNSLEVENFELFWEFLNFLDSEKKQEEILSWAKAHGVSDIETILAELASENILLDSPLKATPYNKRYINYFSAYKNGTAIMERLTKIKVMIIGIGTIGATLALSLAKMNVTNLILIDTDNIEPHNIHAQMAYTLDDIGKKKTVSLSEKLRHFSSTDPISYYDMFINDSTLYNLLNIIEDKQPDLVFSCFDNASYRIHDAIYQKLKEINSHYILNGYFDDEIVSLLLDSDKTKDSILNSYLSFDLDYSFPANRGIITQSLSGALINCYRTLQFADNGTLGAHSISFDIRNLELSKKEFSFSSPSKLLSFLKNNYNLEAAAEWINRLLPVEIAKENQNHLENRLAEISAVLDILRNLDDTSFEHAQEALEQYILEKDEDSFSEIEDSIEKYHTIVDNILLNGQHIFKILAAINYEPSYEKRIELQKNIFNALKESAPSLLPLLKKIKLFHYKNPAFLKEEMKISPHTLTCFSDLFQNDLWETAQPIFQIIFPDNNFDYLFDIDSNIQIHMSFEDSLSFIRDTFSSTANLSYFQSDLFYHIENSINDQFILDIKGKKVYDTYYLPSTNKAVIVFDHFDTMYSILLLVHELGHSYFSRFYGNQFYDNANIIINETLAQFFEILFVHSIFTSSTCTDALKKGAQFHYFYRVNQSVVSALVSEQLERQVVSHLLEYGDISCDDFLELNKPAFHQNNVILKNQENSRLNILLYPPFMTSYKECSIGALTYILAISLFESYKKDLNRFFAKIEKILATPQLTFELFIKEFFDAAPDTDFFLRLKNDFVNHIHHFRKDFL